MRLRIGQKADIREQTSPEGDREYRLAISDLRIADIRKTSATRAIAVTLLAVLLGGMTAVTQAPDKWRKQVAGKIQALLGR